MIQKERIQLLNTRPVADGLYVLYWMQQSQRAHWNHALEYAISRSNAVKKPLLVLFVLTDGFPEANLRHYHFMLQGLADTSRRLYDRGIRMIVVRGDMVKVVLEAARGACMLITDRGYLRIQRSWRKSVADSIECSCVQVESDVVVPVETAAQKEMYSAGILRPKIHRLLDHFLIPLEEEGVTVPSLSTEFAGYSPYASWAKHEGSSVVDVQNLKVGPALEPMNIDHTVLPVQWIDGGTAAAIEMLGQFIELKLGYFDTMRNDPGEEYLSNMSPYLHFGQISPLYIALQVGEANTQATASYLEELIIRRELAMNFVYFNTDYDSYACLPDWARTTLREHEGDRREFLYDPGQLEAAETHDPYWNAAQRELTERGKMHGYMRMYWGKKILEWSPAPQEAFDRALYLNNRYSLDGRDPNGFAGIAWCFGKHDRAWSERPVFGKVRYMNDKGLERKFRIQSYVDRIEGGR